MTPTGPDNELCAALDAEEELYRRLAAEDDLYALLLADEESFVTELLCNPLAPYRPDEL